MLSFIHKCKCAQKGNLEFSVLNHVHRRLERICCCYQSYVINPVNECIEKNCQRFGPHWILRKSCKSVAERLLTESQVFTVDFSSFQSHYPWIITANFSNTQSNTLFHFLCLKSFLVSIEVSSPIVFTILRTTAKSCWGGQKREEWDKRVNVVGALKENPSQESKIASGQLL